MKTKARLMGLLILGAAVAAGGCSKQKTQSLWKTLPDPAVTMQLKIFLSEKQSQANAAGGESIPDFDAFMAAARSGNARAVKSLGQKLETQANKSYSEPRWHGAKMQAVKEIIGTFDAFGDGGDKYSALFANEVIKSIPPGSIYFGGTDPGRFIISAMQTSLADGNPFFTLTQNALADGTYLDYLRSMYGNKIYIPTAEDSQNCFNEYYADVQKRMQNNQLEPGENASVDPASGRMQVSGQVAVMNINGLIVKVIFNHETNREFYLEESFPLQWMYPYLEPHGLIFKLNHAPVDKLSDATVQQDHDYWTKTISPMIGDWLDDDTSVADIAAFNEKVFLNHNFSGFTGDTNYVLNTYSHMMFSKERSSIAGLYVWRAAHASTDAEKQRMNKEADFAFRQAWALCPYSPEAVFRYTQFLMTDNRSSDALLVAETAAKFPGTDGGSNKQIEDLVTSLKNYRPAN